jgi:hypothetical protein
MITLLKTFRCMSTLKQAVFIVTIVCDGCARSKKCELMLVKVYLWEFYDFRNDWTLWLRKPTKFEARDNARHLLRRRRRRCIALGRGHRVVWYNATTLQRNVRHSVSTFFQPTRLNGVITQQTPVWINLVMSNRQRPAHWRKFRVVPAAVRIVHLFGSDWF